ncbi:MAG: radical SAM protein [Bryobacteraceae bacterium]|nr:radical SAM protein [Bryobacteraceae bacterium]
MVSALTNALAQVHSLLPFSDGGLYTQLSAAIQSPRLEAARSSLRGVFSQRLPHVVAAALTVKIVNITLAGRQLRRQDQRLDSKPFGLVVDPSNVCMLGCPGCVHSSTAPGVFDWPNATLPETRWSALLQACGAFAVGVYFCDYGEPLLNRATPKMIREAKTYLLSTSLSTSLSVPRFDAEAYVESGLDSLVASIDGATEGVYGRFRRKGSLELALQNMRALAEAKRRLRRRTPAISWNFLAFEHNAHEIPAARALARRAGANYFRVVKPFDVTWDDPEIVPAAAVPTGVERLDWTSVSHAPENWNPCSKDVKEDAFAAALAAPLPDLPPPSGPASHACRWLYQNLVMDATGRILPCCGAPTTDGKLVFAQWDGSGADAWNSERYRQARGFFSGHGAGDVHCSRCDWDQTTVNIGPEEIRRYFRAAAPGLFDRRSLGLLAACAA